MDADLEQWCDLIPHFNTEEKNVLAEIIQHAGESADRYGDFTSTHEALGVALEEFEELRRSIQQNLIEQTREEAIDLAAVCYRLAVQCRLPSSTAMRERSKK